MHEILSYGLGVKTNCSFFTSAHFIATFCMSQQYEVYFVKSEQNSIHKFAITQPLECCASFMSISSIGFCFWRAMSFVDLQAFELYPAVLQIL